MKNPPEKYSVFSAALRSPMLRGWCIGVFLAAVLETCLVVAASFEPSGEGFSVTVIYFIKELLAMTLPVLSITLLFSLSFYKTPAILLVGAPIYALLFFACRLLTTMFFSNLWYDSLWEAGVNNEGFLWSLFSGDLLSLLLIIAAALVLTLIFSLWFPDDRDNAPTRRIFIALAVVSVAFLAMSYYREIFSFTIPYFESVTNGDTVLHVADAVFIVFKYVFYGVTAFILYLLSKKICKRSFEKKL